MTDSSAGASSDRTTNASMKMPTPSANASSRNGRSGTSARSPKLTASVNAAVRIARADCGRVMASALRMWRARAYFHAGPMPKML